MKPAEVIEEERKSVSSKKPVAEKKRFSYNEKREWENLQNEIKALEGEKKVLSEQINSPSLPYDELMRISSRIAEINEQLDAKEMRWLELSEIAEQ